MTGVSVLGCEIKEEASAAGRRRGTFAPKGTHPRRPPSRGRSALTQSGERPPAGGTRSVLPELVPVDLVLRQQLAQLRGRGALHRLLVDARQRRLAQGICRQPGPVEAQVLGAEDPDREVVLARAVKAQVALARIGREDRKGQRLKPSK